MKRCSVSFLQSRSSISTIQRLFVRTASLLNGEIYCWSNLVGSETICSRHSAGSPGNHVITHHEGDTGQVAERKSWQFGAQQQRFWLWEESAALNPRKHEKNNTPLSMLIIINVIRGELILHSSPRLLHVFLMFSAALPPSGQRCWYSVAPRVNTNMELVVLAFGFYAEDDGTLLVLQLINISEIMMDSPQLSGFILWRVRESH